MLEKSAKNKPVLLFIGLGNPDYKYRKTRHNAGFAVIDSLSEACGAKLKKSFLKPCLIATVCLEDYTLYLVEPLTYMNRSGDVLNYVFRKTGVGVDEMIIICDNMDLKPGMIRLKSKGSSAGHNGIKSVIDNLGRADFKRLYIGVGRPADGMTVIEHVLGEFEQEEETEFLGSVEKAAGALMSLTKNPLHLVMNEINKKNN
ncbi:MAG: aminoacyl-tRNA hydrolase [Spirochaetales bacterium]|nr:aminoacyl-tRNA hydrolase [Spirochaetales bacterium]